MTNKIIEKTFPKLARTNSIFRKAGGQMVQSSFQTAKKIALLYKDAGMETYRIGKKLVSSTLRLTIDNQKELLQTSSQAIREAADTLRPEPAAPKATKSTAKRKSKRKNGHNHNLQIDDLLPEQ